MPHPKNEKTKKAKNALHAMARTAPGSGPAQPLQLAVSLAGHDKGSAYVIWAEDETGCWLTDGRLRPLSRPKYKKHIHLQRVRHLSASVREAAYCGSGDRWQDMDTRRVLRAWRNGTEETETVPDLPQ